MRTDLGLRRASLALLLLLLPPGSTAGDIIVNEIMYRTETADPSEEYLELFNRGTSAYNLAGWRVTQGVTFTFPSVVLGPGQYLVVAADSAAFTNRYPDAMHVVGGWQGRLAENGEQITLVDALGTEQNSVQYATDGDWGVRRRGPDDHGHSGWIWDAEHDGQGKSLELINPWISNRHGQNWSASQVTRGTPGKRNSVFSTSVAPLILDAAHAPIVPRSTDAVTVTARILDESPVPPVVSVFHRIDGATDFNETLMWDDSQHGDGAAGDGVFGAVLSQQTRDTVVEFYIAARDAEGNRRTWPAPVQPADTQSANCLYQVDDSPDDAAFPFYRLISTEAERQELVAIGNLPFYASSDAQMNATFISREAGVTECRYTTGIRLRGWGGRSYSVKSKRVNFPNDRPWRDRTAINLNAQTPQSQILASILCRICGVPTGQARAVQVRENNRQLAMSGAPQFGVFAHVEALDSDYAETHFPADPEGNLYKGISGVLTYLGEDPAPYRVVTTYEKKTNASVDDWSDLIQLTRVLDQTPASNYVAEVGRVADIQEWIRYFAVNTMLANAETSLGTGYAGDYAMYRGLHDPRFQLVAYDLDAALGLPSWWNLDIFRAASTNSPAVTRFLTHPEITPLYLGELRRLATSVFAPDHIYPLIDRILGPFVPETPRQTMKDFVVTRNAFVLSQIPSQLTATTDLPTLPGATLPRATQPSAALEGTADAVRTRRVLVNDRQASWNHKTGRWSLPDLPLRPGVNDVTIRALDANGQEFEQILFPVWYDRGASQPTGGVLRTDTRWRAAEGPYAVSGELVVPAGVTLTIDPGTSVYFSTSAKVTVTGQIRAEGTPASRIYMGAAPGGANGWSGISFVNATNENRLSHLTMGNYGATALWLTNSTLVAEHVVWTNSTRNVIMLDNSSLAVRHSRFPNLEWYEAVSGIGIPANGFLILEGNIFGTTVGYCDVIDFSGGKRPGPVLQVLDNVFLGGSDDALDLDGTDAHIEGNVFMHFHKNNSSTSESSAISTGYYRKTSEIVVVRNLFFDNDNDMILKESAAVWANHNTFVGSRKGSLCFDEPERSSQWSATLVRFDGNIFWQHPVVMRNLDTNLLASHALDLRVDRSILPEPGPWSGVGNLDADPQFANPTNDFRLRPASPARGAGPLGLDMGAFVPPGAALSGEPPPSTWRRDFTLTVGGPGIVSYRDRLNGGPWSAERSISEPIPLTGLADGTYQIEVLGRNSAGVWQPESAPTLSRAWTVAASAARVRLSEVLASNGTAVPWNNAYPDLIELHNDSPNPADLSGLSLTDDLSTPPAFTFPENSILAAGEYLVLIADRDTAASGLHLGFQLSREGGRVALFDRAANGGQLLDIVHYGMQVQGLSIAWTDSGEWRLASPTFGGPNQPVPLGDSSRVRINEWLANAGASQRNDFIELYNPEVLPVALGGFFLTDEPAGWPRRHPLPPLTFIPARGYALFVAHGDPEQGGDHLGFRLALEQGMLGLFDIEATPIDLIAYGPQIPDRSEGRTPSGSSSIVFFENPTPGAPPGPTDPSSTPVVLSEVLAHPLPSSVPATPNTDWIELHNRGQAAIDLGGLSLTDRTDEPRRWVFPAGTTIEPGSFLLVRFDSTEPASGTNTGFGLSASGDAIYLFDRPENDGLLLDALTFGIQPAGYSLGRMPAEPALWRLTSPTPGQPNQTVDLGPPEALRINEWMADPVEGDDWFEVFNPGPRPVELSGLRLTDELAVPTKSVVPTLSFIGVGPSAYQVFVADGEPAKGADHVDFKLSGGGEAVSLATFDGFLIDAVTFGTQQEGVSEGRLPDGSDRVVRFPLTPTPGARNRDNAAPELTVARVGGANVRLSWTASLGTRYAVERTRSLASGQWITLVEIVADGSEAHYTEPLTPTGDSFYRLRTIP